MIDYTENNLKVNLCIPNVVFVWIKVFINQLQITNVDITPHV